MTRRKLLLLVLLFLVYEVLAWLLSSNLSPDSPWVIFLILTACGLTLLVVYILISRLTSKLASQPAQASGPEASPPAPARSVPARDEDLEPISSLVAEANDRLAKSPTLANSKVRPSVTTLPLYLLLGVEGSGKTSAVVASELLPELLAGEVFRDSALVPTRVLNLWFAGGGVIAEPSGRFFSTDPCQLQRLVASLLGIRGASWISRILSRRQQGQQLKGAILCCPIDGLLGVPDAARQAAVVRQLQERLRKIGETIGADFPVYVVFTKCDAIPYFGEYFAHLMDGEDRQILGCTLPLNTVPGRGQSEVYAVAQTKRVSEFFNRLYYSLAEQRAIFLRREPDRAKKPPIYEFPRELKRIRGTLVQFLVDLFRPNPLQPGPLLRGFYFTGVREVPIAQASAARAKLSPAESYKLGQATRLFRREELQKTPQPEVAADTTALTPVWSFVPDLFRQIVVSDRDRVGGTFVDRKLDLYRRIAFASVTLVALLLCTMFFVSWFYNHDLLQNAKEAGEGSRGLARASDTPTPDNLEQIEKLRCVLKEITDYRYHRTPWHLDFSLYAGDGIYQDLHDLYFKRFREYFLARRVREVESRLAGLPASSDPAHDYKSVYDDLKGYRTITNWEAHLEERRCSPDDESLGWLIGSWQGNRLAELQFGFYFDELRAGRDPYPDSHPEPVAVKKARGYLAADTGIEPVYAGIIDSVNQELQTAARLSDYTQKAPEALDLKAGDVVLAAYTLKGWERVQQKIATAGQGTKKSACVFGDVDAASAYLPGQGSDTKRLLTNRYIQEYIKRWKTFLDNTTVLPYKSHQDAARKLDVLSSPASPLLAVLAMTAENTKLAQSFSATNQVAKQAESKAKPGFFSKFSRAGRAADAAKTVLPPTQPQEKLDPQKIGQLFQPTQAVFKVPNHNHLVDEVNTKYITALSDLQVTMNDLAGLSDPNSNQELNNRANQKAQAALQEAKTLAYKFDSTPEGVSDTVSTFLEAPIRASFWLIQTDPTKAAKGKLDGALRDLCGNLHPMLQKYPFNLQAGQDQEFDPAKLQQMFGPSGLFRSFQQQFTTKLLEQRGRQWVQKPDTDPKLSEAFLRFFSRMDRVSSALFLPDGEHPQMQFKLSMQASTGIDKITGNVDGDEFSLTAKPYTWPGQKPGIDLRVVQTGNINSSTFAKYDGLWGLFRWMQSAEQRAPGSAIFDFIYQRATPRSQAQPILENLNPIKIQVNEFPNKIDSAFDKDFFAITCPGRATQ
jgi:type VI secretion system protein ImpL